MEDFNLDLKAIFFNGLKELQTQFNALGKGTSAIVVRLEINHHLKVSQIS